VSSWSAGAKRSDLLVLAVVGKSIWGLAKAGRIWQKLFLLGAISLTVLLGLSGCPRHTVLREGLSIAIPLVFAALPKLQGALPVDFAFLGALGCVYPFGTMTRLTGQALLRVSVAGRCLHVLHVHRVEGVRREGCEGPL